MKNIIISLLLLVLMSACGSSSSGGDSGNMETDNPIVERQLFGQNGNLYKPSADPKSSGAGNLVVLLGQQFTTRFNSCEIKLASGEVAQLLCIDNEDWTQVPFSCFSNGNRQTWRANFTCDKVAEVLVTCRDAMQEVVFTVPDELRGLVCNRFG